MTGCGKEETNQGIIISAGDNSNITSNNSSSNSIENQDNNTVNNSDIEAKDNTGSDVNNIEKENNEFSLYGIWTDANNNIISLYDNGIFDATLLSEAKSIYGTYETNNNTYIKLTYNKSEKIENPTEQEVIINNGIRDVETTVELTLSIDETARIIKLNDVEMSLYSEVESEVTVTQNVGDTSITESNNEDEKIVTDEAELEQIRQELIDMGIDPDTGLPMEDSQKLIDMGIDPLTRQPIQSESIE